jgi:hypothetical protein
MRLEAISFQYTPVQQPWLSKIPPDTDILVTHTPPVRPWLDPLYHNSHLTMIRYVEAPSRQ